ncbi:hypothetical protein GCM10022248_86210 [Nonomuraea soli]
MACTSDGWTLFEAEVQLDPRMTQTEIRSMITLFGINPCGQYRPPGRRGRAYATYSPTLLMHAHAIVVRARVDLSRIGVS